MTLEEMLDISIENKDQLREIARGIVISLNEEDEYSLLKLSEEAQKAISLPDGKNHVWKPDEIFVSNAVEIRGREFEMDEFAEGFVNVARKKLRKFSPDLIEWLDGNPESASVFDVALQADKASENVRRFEWSSNGDFTEVTIYPTTLKRSQETAHPEDELAVRFKDGSFFVVTDDADIIPIKKGIKNEKRYAH
jgi:hypothetical protein